MIPHPQNKAGNFRTKPKGKSTPYTVEVEIPTRTNPNSSTAYAGGVWKKFQDASQTQQA